MRKRTAILLLILVIISFCGVLVRCFYLQYYKIDYYRQISERAQKSTLFESPRRGAILDCKGRILAAGYKVDTVFAEPRIIINTDMTKIIQVLSDILEISKTEIANKILTAKNPGYAPILTDIKLTNSQRKQISKIRGLGIQTNWRRFYPLGRTAAHIVGFVGSEQNGLAGIELKYNSELSGTVGKSIFLSDSARRPVRLKDCNQFATDGADIITTIDATVQEFTHEALLKTFQQFEAESATAMVIVPYDGAVKAMVSLPDFDPENLSTADGNSLANHILSDPYEPGSIFKPIIASWALDCKAVDRNEKIFCENGNYHGRGFGTIGEYRRGYGDLTLSEIIAYSSNIGMAKIGQRMGAEKLYEGIRLFGFGRKTGIDLAGEDCGLVWPPDKWNGYSIARVPFGHEIMVTALQMTCAFCTIANDGRIVQPYIAKAVVSDAGKKIKIVSPVASGGFIINNSTANWMVQKAMTETVKIGTGKKAALDKWQVWGKTGTANIAASNKGGYDEKNYVASFIGGAPAHRPQIVVLVSVRKPNRKLGKGYTGGTVAAPAAAEIIEKTLTYLGH